MWQSNIDLIRSIPENDPLFNAYLTQVANKLKEQEYKYYDDHEDKKRKQMSKYITLCTRYNREGELESIQRS